MDGLLGPSVWRGSYSRSAPFAPLRGISGLRARVEAAPPAELPHTGHPAGGREEHRLGVGANPVAPLALGERAEGGVGEGPGVFHEAPPRPKGAASPPVGTPVA